MSLQIPFFTCFTSYFEVLPTPKKLKWSSYTRTCTRSSVKLRCLLETVLLQHRSLPKTECFAVTSIGRLYLRVLPNYLGYNQEKNVPPISIAVPAKY